VSWLTILDASSLTPESYGTAM